MAANVFRRSLMSELPDLVVVLMAIVASTLVSLAMITGYNLWYMRKHPEWYLFPAITGCPVCDKRIYVWDRRLRKTWPLPVLNETDEVVSAVSASLTGTVHMRCKDGEIQDRRPVIRTCVVAG
jgi:hypothetical protein